MSFVITVNRVLVTNAFDKCTFVYGSRERILNVHGRTRSSR